MGNNCCSYEGDQLETGAYGVEGPMKRRGLGSTATQLKRKAVQEYQDRAAALNSRGMVFEDHEFPAELETI